MGENPALPSSLVGTSGSKAILQLEVLCSILVSFPKHREPLIGVLGNALHPLCLFTPVAGGGRGGHRLLCKQPPLTPALRSGNSSPLCLIKQ